MIMRNLPILLIAAMVLPGAANSIHAEPVGAGLSIKIDFGPAPKPTDPDNKYFAAAKGTVDAFLEHATVEVRGTPVFAEEIDLKQLKPSSDRHSINENGDLYRLAWFLSDATGDPRYARFADAAVAAVLYKNQPPNGIPFWGEDHHVRQPGPMGKWFRLAPYACERAALGWWINGIGNKLTGDFNRHTNCKATGAPYARHGAYRMSWWAHAYRHTWIEEYLQYTAVLADFYENWREKTGHATGQAYGQNALLTMIGWQLTSHIPNQHPTDAVMKKLLHGNVEKMLENTADRNASHGWEDLANAVALYHVYLHELAAGNEELASRVRVRLLKMADGYKTLDAGAARKAQEAGLHLEILMNAHLLEPDDDYLEAARRAADAAMEKFYDQGPIPRSQAGKATFKGGQMKTDMLPLQLFRLGMIVDGQRDWHSIHIAP